MRFDDRLATVIAMQAGSDRAARTQFRQLLDLAGSAPEGTDENQLEIAYARIGELSAVLDAGQRAEIIREPGLRLRNPGFIAFLASQEMPVASAALTTARLTDEQWQALLPALPVPVRALLRERRDLPENTRNLLSRLGVSELVLPEPLEKKSTAPAELQGVIIEQPAESVLDLDPALELDKDDSTAGIRALVQRIEAFRRVKRETTPAHVSEAPRLPLGERAEDKSDLLVALDFITDTDCRIIWAETEAAPMVVGVSLASDQPIAPARPAPAMLAAIRHRQPIRAARMQLDGAREIAGEWWVDAVPHFAQGGRFTGYRGRMRRPVENCLPQLSADAEDSTEDRIRQIIHELRTPVNAIQGFAEIIQQQLFGPTPHEYRALAASIAGDAARILAGFDELDRLAKLESGAMELEAGMADFHAAVTNTAAQLDTVLRPRNAGLELASSASYCPVAMSQADAEMLAWRVLAALTGAMNPGEILQIVLAQDGRHAVLEIDLPDALAARDNIFESSAPQKSQTVNASMFGAGFALRLARAEARALGGDLKQEHEVLELLLPLSSNLAGENQEADMDLKC